MRCLMRFALDASARAVPSLSPTSQWKMWFVLLLAVGPQQHLVGLRRERIGDDRQRRVVHLHRFGAVDGGRARLREHGGDFLVLEEHLADREHHLLVEAVEGRQPAEAGGLEILAGDHGLDARHLHRLADVDVLDLGVRVRAAHQREVEHAREARGRRRSCPLPWMKRGSSLRFIATPTECRGFASMVIVVPRERQLWRPRRAGAASRPPAAPP